MTTQRKHTALIALLSISAFTANTHAFSIGDFAFTSFNADEDGFSLATFVNIPANSLLYFTDNEATGLTSFNAGESYSSWATGGSIIPAGSVVRFTNVDNATTLAASIGTLARETVTANTNWGLSNGSDTLFLFEGTSATAPTKVLTAVSSASASDYTLAGLATGTSAVLLPGNTRFGQYTGARSGLAAYADYFPLIEDAANWTSTTAASQAATVPSTAAFTIVPEPSTGVAVITGIGMLLNFRRRRSA